MRLYFHFNAHEEASMAKVVLYVVKKSASCKTMGPVWKEVDSSVSYAHVCLRLVTLVLVISARGEKTGGGEIPAVDWPVCRLALGQAFLGQEAEYGDNREQVRGPHGFSDSLHRRGGISASVSPFLVHSRSGGRVAT